MISDTDHQGWIMSGISGLACALGSAIICVDVIARRCLGRRDFEIAKSDVFLASSLSLSGGVVLFTSLYSMLPTSKDYLIRAGHSSRTAAYILIGLFLSGVIVINIFSSLLHRWMPAQVVACAHSHSGIRNTKDIEAGTIASESHSPQGTHIETTERTPLLSVVPNGLQSNSRSSSHHSPAPPLLDPTDKPSVAANISDRLNVLIGGKNSASCSNNPCFGVSQTCGKECAKISSPNTPAVENPAVSATRHEHPLDPTNIPPHIGVTNQNGSSNHYDAIPSSTSPTAYSPESMPSPVTTHHHHHQPDHPQHHHHVPKNAFLSIGLQTSLAIALHKLPEGFITYATNHTNPALGWSVFVAIFIHNITEGFAMSLPLYLALQSKFKAILWSSLLGGISQPAGAGIAALWIWSTTHTDNGGGNPEGPSWGVYGGMFAVTAGVMANVGLQLLLESMALSHRRSLCIGSAFVGMGIVGLSFALTS
ncbi:hypothetical protein FQN57_004974 [Myotisia sp. PD_48]|nr:hypothetical protein FQN57_004974 [Myotisia sp. PD_48]